MSELHEIDGIVFGGEKYTVGEGGAIPEGLIDPWAIEWIGYGSYSGGALDSISPAGLPVKLPDIDSAGNLITSFGFNFTHATPGMSGVILPSHLEEIRNSVFRDGQLEFVEFGDHLTSIGNLAFRGNQLTSLDLPDSLTSIGDNAFRNNQLTSVTFGNSLTSIGEYAFTNNQLTSLVIPDSVTSIEIDAFANNPLEEVSVGPNTNYAYGAFPFGIPVTVRDE